ncbi:MAG: serine hydrolase domain-containing protein [Alphaproteobacteria bacterium]
MTSSLDLSALNRAVALIEAHMAEGRQPGATLAVAHRGEVVLERVFGEARLGTPADLKTLWLLYSNTKVVTAAALWLLVEEGRLRFEDRIAQHMPDFAANGKGGITVIQLLTHQGGFPNAVVPEAAWEDPALLRATVCGFSLETTPGSVVHYHALAAHWVAAALIRAVTGDDHRAFIRDRVIKPLGLEKDLFIGVPSSEQARVADIYDPSPQGFVARQPECSKAHYEAGVPGGGGYATARAMALFYQSLIGQGRPLVAPRVMAYVTRNFTGDRVDLAQGLPMHRGLGPHARGTTDGARGLGSLAHPSTFGHGGVGSSYCWGDPASGVSFAFIANARQADVDWHLARMDRLSNLVHAAIR